eukprot:TRINITY_DN5067_c0_g1_i1.p1 TRINITY_DN5067_c0_g1~~TRINITY_DN5067_c0_g1_i1.p1  ORF type:complete len:227 (+),score=56.46 TRINITY_DN5067_c0_g1_i1:276-956(+)
MATLLDTLLDDAAAEATRPPFDWATTATTRSAAELAQLPIVFAIPGADWMPNAFDQLAERLAGAARVCVLSRPADDCSGLSATASALALIVCEVMQQQERTAATIAPPHAVVGYSSGGLLAFEVTRVLQSTEFAPQCVVLLESFVRCGLEAGDAAADALWRSVVEPWLDVSLVHLQADLVPSVAEVHSWSPSQRDAWFQSHRSAARGAEVPSIDALLRLHCYYGEV